MLSKVSDKYNWEEERDMSDFNETLELDTIDETAVEARLAVELEERQELAWVAMCETGA